MEELPWNPVITHTVTYPRYAPGGKAPSEEILAETVSRIRDVVEPLKIILFGSAGREEMTRHSDLDFLVVVNPQDDKNALAHRIRRQLHVNMRDAQKDCLGFAYDVVVATPKTMEELGPCQASVYGAALEEGKVLYEHQG